MTCETEGVQSRDGAPEHWREKEVTTLGLLSLIFSSSALLIWPVGFVPGIIMGHVARHKARSLGGDQRATMALAGLIIGYVMMTIFVLSVLVVLSIPPSMP